MKVLLAADATSFAQPSETNSRQSIASSRLPAGSAPMLVALLGCAFWALEASGADLHAAVAALLLAGCLSCRDRRCLLALQMAAANTRLYTQSLHGLADASLARWSRHIDTVRQQTETAGTELDFEQNDD